MATVPLCAPVAAVGAEPAFVWPELDEAEAELGLRGMVAGYLAEPTGDPDQVRA